MEAKFNQIVDSYFNGNIAWVKQEVKKLSKDNRKKLFNYSKEYNQLYDGCQDFFFDLI